MLHKVGYCIKETNEMGLFLHYILLYNAYKLIIILIVLYLALRQGCIKYYQMKEETMSQYYYDYIVDHAILSVKAKPH